MYDKNSNRRKINNPSEIVKFIDDCSEEVTELIFEKIEINGTHAHVERYVSEDFVVAEIDAGVLFDSSLRRTITQVIYSLETWTLFITTKECEDNTTNITPDVIEAILKVVKWVTRHDDNIKHLM